MTAYDAMPISAGYFGRTTNPVSFNRSPGTVRRQEDPTATNLVPGLGSRQGIGEKWHIVVPSLNSWLSTPEMRTVSPVLKALAEEDGRDFDEVAAMIRSARKEDLDEVEHFVSDEAVDASTRALVLESLATTRMPALEDTVVGAIRAGLASDANEVVFAAISSLPTLSPARRSSLRLTVDDIATKSSDIDVRRAAQAFLSTS